MPGPITTAILARADNALVNHDVATIDQLHERLLDMLMHDPEVVAEEGELYDLLEYLNILYDLLSNPSAVTISEDELSKYRKDFDDS